MHILIIPSWYKTSIAPVVGTFFEDQARSLVKKGHQVGILFPEFYSFSSKKSSENTMVIDDNLPTYYSSYKALIPQSYKLNYYLFGQKIYKTYLEYVKSYGVPNIIHAHAVFYGGIAAMYISKKANIPFVITEHFTPLITGSINKKADINVVKKVFKTSERNLIVSTGFKELLTKNLSISEELFEVLPNMVSDLFFNQTGVKQVDKSAPVFFTMSFLSERKNHKLMLDSFALFLKEVPGAIFRIGGDGPIMEILKSYSVKIGVDKQVSFLGELSRERVAQEMNACDIFLLASTFETFGVVLIEALACGKPIVTTDSIGPRDIVNKNNGILVPSFAVADYFQSMMKVFNNQNQYDSNKIKEDCRFRFSEEVIVRQLEKFYLND